MMLIFQIATTILWYNFIVDQVKKYRAIINERNRLRKKKVEAHYFRGLYDATYTLPDQDLIIQVRADVKRDKPYFKEVALAVNTANASENKTINNISIALLN